MKTDRLIRKVINPSVDLSADYPKGHMNGLIIAIDPSKLLSGGDPTRALPSLFGLFDFLNNAVVRVKYYNKSTATVLISSIPLRYFIDISDLKHGATGYTVLERFVTEVNSVDSPDKLAKLQELLGSVSRSDYPFIQIYLDLGSIDCDGGDEIKLDLSSTLPTGSDIGELSVYSYSENSDPFHLMFYDIDFDLNELHDQVVESYVVADVDTSLENDFDIEVRSTNDNYVTDRTGLRSTATIFNKIENKVLDRTLPCFSGNSELPEDVYIKLISRDGRNLPNIGIMNVRQSSDIDKYFVQRRKLENKVNEVLDKASRNDKSSDLVQVIAAEASK